MNQPQSMRARRTLALLSAPFAALILAVAPAAFAQPQRAAALPNAQAAQATRFDAAREEYEIGHFGTAFAAFAQLADEGHCEAARVAHQMVRHGRQLYAMEFSVAAPRLARWRELPGCPVALAGR
ncbi:MAG: hypothetical protein JNN03_02585 [Rubrivivax sp.]|nr:hypothetical protein [Rubrivivax sp.]